MEGHTELLHVFPEEIWRVILGFVDDHEDLESLSNTSPIFRTLLSSKAPIFLFGKVLKVLSHHLKDEFISISTKCRLVCVSWNKTVENHYESHPTPDLEMFSFPQRNRCGITQFLEHFQSTHCSISRRNPVMGRAVIFDDTQFHPGLNCTGPHYLATFYADISRFLATYGGHLFHCKIRLTTKFSSVEDYYLQLCEWLDLMPNLHSLTLISRYGRITKDVCRHLEQIISRFPLPKLMNLKQIKMTKVPKPILNEIFLKNGFVSGMNSDLDTFMK